MSNKPSKKNNKASNTNESIDQDVSQSSAYDIIQKRLKKQSDSLEALTKNLNTKRLEEFGSSEMSVLGRLRVRTENNCIARDIAQVGDFLVFGYNVFIGLKKETHIEDVFMLYQLKLVDDQYEFETIPLQDSFLSKQRFASDFKELYTYYKNARLIQLIVKNNKLLASFQIGNHISDIRVFRWAIGNDNKLTYIDNRGESDIALPPAHDFEWINTAREDSVHGRHPHINILDTVFVETIGGDLTIKIENNTETGAGIYEEPVDAENQSIDDADIAYADLGKFILLKILPYRESTTRYLVFNKETEKVDRIDAIGQSCRQLPEDHGIIFPGGIYLQNGETKTFADNTNKMRFKRSFRSPNGEDILYVFYEPEEGKSALFSYNMIEKDLANPLFGHGYSFYDDGRMVIFNSESEEPTRIHPMQVWQTAFTSEEFASQTSHTSASFYSNIGNAELVRGISELYSISRSINKQSASQSLYNQLSQAYDRLLNSYFWLGKEEVGDIKAALHDISQTSELVLDEFEKVESIRQRANEAMQEAEAEQQGIFSSLLADSWDQVEEFVNALDSIRKQRGHLLTIKEYRYIDQQRIGKMDEALIEKQEELGKQTLLFLSEEKALQPYQEKLTALNKDADQAETRVQISAVIESYEKMAGDLDLISELVSTLHVDDATLRTRIIEGISTIYAKLNQSKAQARHKYKELGSAEAVAQFSVQFKLFGQSIANAVGLATTPDKADEQLNRLLIQLEELEGQFSEHDEFLVDIISKREEVYETFESHKQSLISERQRRAQNLLDAAERILTSITRRTKKLTDIDALNTLFASDPLVIKIRDIAEKLRSIDDSVKADDIESRLKNSKDQALRAQRDKSEIYEEGGKIIKLGRHRFSVTTQELDLSILHKNDKQGGHLSLHLNGTDYNEPIENEALNAQKEFWTVEIESESPQLYRAEYLAGLILENALHQQQGLDFSTLETLINDEASLLKIVHDFAAPRYKEGYEKGIHDYDATKILQQLLPIYKTSKLLRFSPEQRGLAVLFWSVTQKQSPQNSWQRRAISAKQLVDVFNHHDASKRLQNEIANAFDDFLAQYPIAVKSGDKKRVADYLAQELAQDELSFTASQYAKTLLDDLQRNLKVAKAWAPFQASLKQLKAHHHERWALTKAWLNAMLEKPETEIAEKSGAHYIPEAIALLLCEEVKWKPNNARLEISIEGMMGDHVRLKNRSLNMSLDDFLSRFQHHQSHVLTGYHDYLSLRSRIMKEAQDSLRLDEFKPRPLSSFVRNRLINELYLSLIGDNLAKQMGTVGEDKRTDLMGLLMMISPPGYGKTTLMEYVASRLGLIFMKINCPSLGHDVLSLDPEQAPNATAAQELNKLNLALEMSNNVMLYLDDIQHTNPEFLQKFISLSDGTRRIDGIWKGQTKTYDMRGKRFCIIMAGNPYTESGDVFRIPDMLANRADIYNLGDMLGDHEEAFGLSYIENSLTANKVLAPLATREMSDTYLLIDMAKGKQVATTDLKHNYSGAELNEIVEVLKKMFIIQEVILKVNQQYIISAAQNNDYRTEPPFKLQGSYRNMNKMAEKLSAVMNQQEMMQMIEDHYLGEAQLLTTGAEENLLKLAELRGNMTKAQKKRWEAIKEAFLKNKMKGNEEATIGLEISEKLGALVENVHQVNQSLNNKEQTDTLANHLGDITQSLNAFKALAEQPKETKNEALTLHLGEMNQSIQRFHKAFETPKENDALLAQALMEISQKLQIINSAVSSKSGSTAIAQQLGRIVDSMDIMNRELEEVSDTSQEKLRWLTRLRHKTDESKGNNKK